MWWEQLVQLEKQKSEYESKIFEGSRVIRNLSATLKRLQERDDEDLRKEAERNSWWTFFTSPIYGKQAPETEDQRRQRAFHRIERLHTKSIKEKELIQEEANLNNLKDRRDDAVTKIAVLKQKKENARLAEEARVQERVRKEQEAKRQAEAKAERERQAKWRAEWEAEAARRRKEEEAKRAARQAKEAQEAQEAQKRARAAQEAEEAQKARLAQVFEKIAREAREGAQAAKKKEAQEASSRTFASTQSLCRHNAFWPKIEGGFTCSNCRSPQRHFAFKCPGCAMIACASCRQTLRGERRRKRPSKNVNVGLQYEDYDYL